MNKNSILLFMDYLSLILILSFLIFHNIYMVLFGMLLALYLMNNKFLNNIIKLEKFIKIFNHIIFTTKSKNTDIPNIELDKGNIPFSLVEEIEETGFIPSLNNQKDSNAA